MRGSSTRWCAAGGTASLIPSHEANGRGGGGRGRGREGEALLPCLMPAFQPCYNCLTLGIRRRLVLGKVLVFACAGSTRWVPRHPPATSSLEQHTHTHTHTHSQADYPCTVQAQGSISMALLTVIGASPFHSPAPTSH